MSSMDIVSEFDVYPVLTATAIIFDSAGHLLLIRENYGQHRYGPPGGRVETDESPAQGVIREVLEETDAHVAVERLIGIYYFADEPWLAFAFRCSLEAGTPQGPDSGEIAEVGWFDPGSLPQPLTHLLSSALDDALSGTFGHVRHFTSR